MRRVRNEKGGIAAALSEAQKLVFGPFIVPPCMSSPTSC